ncbi:unnamed protein product [Sphagnum tenellum]
MGNNDFPWVLASRCSIVVSIPACHAGDPGSIPGSGALLSLLFLAPCSSLLYGLTAVQGMLLQKSVAEHLSLCWILITAQTKGIAGDARGFKLSLTVYLLKPLAQLSLVHNILV